MRPRGQRVHSLAQSGVWVTTVHLGAHPVPLTSYERGLQKIRARTPKDTSADSEVTSADSKVTSAEYHNINPMRPRGQRVHSLAQSGVWVTTVHLEARPVPLTSYERGLQKIQVRTAHTHT